MLECLRLNLKKHTNFSIIANTKYTGGETAKQTAISSRNFYSEIQFFTNLQQIFIREKLWNYTQNKILKKNDKSTHRRKTCPTNNPGLFNSFYNP